MTRLDEAIRRFAALNISFVEHKRQHRRKCLLGSFEYDPRGTWEKLTEEEKQDKEFVLKGLTCTPCVFGCPWWYETDGGPYEEFPGQFMEDRDALLAFISRHDFVEFLRQCELVLSKSMLDDKDIILAFVPK